MKFIKCKIALSLLILLKISPLQAQSNNFIHHFNAQNQFGLIGSQANTLLSFGHQHLAIPNLQDITPEVNLEHNFSNKTGAIGLNLQNRYFNSSFGLNSYFPLFNLNYMKALTIAGKELRTSIGTNYQNNFTTNNLASRNTGLGLNVGLAQILEKWLWTLSYSNFNWYQSQNIGSISHQVSSQILYTQKINAFIFWQMGHLFRYENRSAPNGQSAWQFHPMAALQFKTVKLGLGTIFRREFSTTNIFFKYIFKETEIGYAFHRNWKTFNAHHLSLAFFFNRTEREIPVFF